MQISIEAAGVFVPEPGLDEAEPELRISWSVEPSNQEISLKELLTDDQVEELRLYKVGEAESVENFVVFNLRASQALHILKERRLVFRDATLAPVKCGDRPVGLSFYKTN